MSKPIFLTKEYVDKMVEEFRRNVSDLKMSDGKITFTKSFDYTGEDDTKAYVLFKPVAYVKMLTLLKHFDSEVAWHGTIERLDDDKFIITDIVVYPQTVTGSTVNTDQEEYQKWTMTLEDDYFNAMRMQGHSHVNMSTNPSSVDTNHQQQILAQLKGQEYYIFMIFNKRLEHTIKIYDYANNVMYEDKDVVVGVFEEGFDNDAFIAAADASVKRKAYAQVPACGSSYSVYSGYSGRNYPYAAQYIDDDDDDKPAKQTSKSSKGKEKSEGKSKGKRGRSSKAEEKDGAALTQMSMSGYPGYYGGNNAVDWDQEIFGSHRFDT